MSSKNQGRTISFALKSVVFLFVSMNVTLLHSQIQRRDVAKEEQTTLDLYLNSRDAYDMWKARKEKVIILDVRTNEEYYFIGHAEMAWNIPFVLQEYHWDLEKKVFPTKPNPEFLDRVKELFKPQDTILVICRSGSRSTKAVNKLAEAGYKNVYNIIDGFEGDVVEDKESVFYGQRMKNGWKNSGLPWTYHVSAEKMLAPKNK